MKTNATVDAFSSDHWMNGNLDSLSWVINPPTISENSKDVLEFKSWGSSPATRKYWTHRGMVYAELLKSPSTGMPKIIVVSSGPLFILYLAISFGSSYFAVLNRHLLTKP